MKTLNYPSTSSPVIDDEQWSATRSGARSGRGFRYQDAAGAWLAVLAWAGSESWDFLVPEGVDDITIHGVQLEIRAQLKSRHDPRGMFTVSEVAEYLAKSASATDSNRPDLLFAVVLERPVVGLRSTGWHETLAASDQNLTSLRAALADLMPSGGTVGIDGVLERTHLIVEALPMNRAVDVLEERLNVPAALARLIAQRLRENAGSCADSNYSAPSTNPAVLGFSQVQLNVDAVLSLSDPSSIDEPVRLGFCEVVDFGQPVVPSDFYSGVDVLPGHVSAGLVFARPASTTAALKGLEHRRAVLVAGPSGCGKSAVAWLTAYATRHEVRWYRVRRVRPDDVHLFIELARKLEATPSRPVGFVIDDVGHVEQSGWDELIRRIQDEPGVLVLGTVREEDVLLLSTAAALPMVRPVLDEELAERIWAALSEEGSTQAEYWREPLETSRGLLLEYTHLLTQKQQLVQTLTQQVNKRLVENRGDELLLLRTISFAACHGGAVDPARLRSRLGMSETQFARALQRLLKEHAIREASDGSLAGLHEIRSTYLNEILRAVLPMQPQDLLVEVVDTLRPADFATFIVRVLRTSLILDDTLIDALVNRMMSNTGPNESSIFYGLGLATVDRIASKWVEISRSAGIEDQHASMAFGFALTEADLASIPQFERISRAIASFSSVLVQDLRYVLWDRLPNGINPDRRPIAEANELYASLLPLVACGPLPHRPLPRDVETLDAPLVPLLEMLRTARELDIDLACSLASAFGGIESLLDRLYHEIPWATKPARRVADGVDSVLSDIRFISDESQPNLHDEVVRLCELLLAADPESELVIANAVFPDGSPFGIADFKVATKRIPRCNLPAPARTAWNRAVLRAVQRLVGARTETQRTAALASAIAELATKLREAGEFYCRSEKPNTKWIASVALREILTGFVPPPPNDVAASGPLDQGNYSMGDPLLDFVTGLQSFVRRLTIETIDRPVLLAATAVTLAAKAETISDPTAWRWIADTPLQSLNEIRGLLLDLRAVLGDAQMDPDGSARTLVRLSRTSRRNPALPRAADDARVHCSDVVAERCRELDRLFSARNIKARVFSRPSAKDEGFNWPAVEYAVLLEVSDLVSYFALIPSAIEISAAVEDTDYLLIAPLVRAQVAPLGMRLSRTIPPYPSAVEGWRDQIDVPFLSNGRAERFGLAIDNLRILSSIATERGRQMNSVEQTYFDKVVERSSHDELLVSELSKTDDGELAAAGDFLANAFYRVRAEIDGSHYATPLAVELGQTGGDFQSALFAHRVVLLQRDLELGGATLPAASIEANAASAGPF